MENLEWFQKITDVNSRKITDTVVELRRQHPLATNKELANKLVNGQSFKSGVLAAIPGAMGVINLPVFVGAVAADTAKTLRVQAFILGCIARIYDIDPKDELSKLQYMLILSSNSVDEVREQVKKLSENILEEFLAEHTRKQFGQAAAINAGKKLAGYSSKAAVGIAGKRVADWTMKGMTKHLTKMFWRIGGRKVAERTAAKAAARAVPVIGAVAGFTLDWSALQSKSKVAIEFYEQGIPILLNSLLQMSKPPSLQLVSPSLSPKHQKALIYIQGFSAGNPSDWKTSQSWVQKLRNLGWRGSIYKFYWDSSALGQLFLDTATDFKVAGNLAKGFSKSSTVSSVLWGIENFMIAWRNACKSTLCLGLYYLPELVATSELLDSKSITLVGHSLGARIAYNAAHAWNATLPTLENLTLLGGAHSASSTAWREVADKVESLVLNVYNPSDAALNSIYRMITWESNPYGLSSTPISHPSVKNVNVGGCLGIKHFGFLYLEALYQHLHQPLWKPS